MGGMAWMRLCKSVCFALYGFEMRGARMGGW